MAEPKQKLTASTIEKLEPRDKPYIVRDSKTPYLGVLVSPGGTKTWIWERKINKSTSRKKLGRVGSGITEKMARDKADVFNGLAAQNINPVEQIKKAENVLTLQVAIDQYLERNLKESTKQDVLKAMKHLSDWMERPLQDITPAMVERRHKLLTDNASGSGARANLVMRYLRAIINHCSELHADENGKPLIQNNPVRRLSALKQWNRDKRRRSFVRPEDMAAWMEAVTNGLIGLKNADEVRDCYLLSMLTGVRPSEALNLTWDCVDFKHKSLTFKDTKNHSDHELPLTDWLAGLLVQRRAISGHFERVFSDSQGICPKNLRRAQERIEKATGLHIMPTDLRRTFITAAERLDIGAYTLKRMLNHTIQGGDVTAGYIVLTVDRLREPMQRIEDKLLTDAGLKSADIIQGHFGRATA